jgi:hypothetical protein
MDNKRGQGLSTNAIILIILGVVVLVVLILGFTMGWSRIAPWLSNDNVDTIVQQCAVACSTNSVYDYCTKERELNDGKNKVTGTCVYFQNSNKYGLTPCSLSCEGVGEIYQDKSKAVLWCNGDKDAKKDIRVYYFDEGFLKSEKCSVLTA